MNNITKIIISALILVAIAFYGGLKYGQSNSSAQTKGIAGQFAGGLARRSGNGGGGLIRGEIIKKDAESLTIALPTSGSQIIWYSTSTEVQKMVKSKIDDLTIGQTVMINGSTNSDSSLTAQLIQLR